MRKFCLLVGLLSLIPANEARAQCVTDVAAGTIAGETWTQAGSPYCLKGDIQIEDLAIGPGVRVAVDGNYEIEIIGTLTAIGTEPNPVVFTTTLTNTVGWQGILFNVSTPGSELAHFVVERSIDTGIEIISSQPTIRDCTIQNNSRTRFPGGGGVYTRGSAVTLTRCLITGNVVSVDGNAHGGGILSDFNSDLTLIDSDVSGNETVSAGSSTAARGGGI